MEEIVPVMPDKAFHYREVSASFMAAGETPGQLVLKLF